MRFALVVAVTVSLSMMGRVGAAEDRREDAPRLLKDAVRTGTAEPADLAAIVSWVLHEKEETVAAGFAEVLGSLDVPAAANGNDGERWAPVASAMVDLFTAALRDAQTHRVRRGTDVPPELVALMRAAAPAVAASLREASPESLEPLRAALSGFSRTAGKDVVPELVRALRHEDATVRRGAATLLSTMGPAAQVAMPDLRAALDDPDPDVRAAARAALTQLGEK